MQCMMRTWCMHEPYVLTNLGRILKFYRIVRWHTHVLSITITSRSTGDVVSVPAENCISAQQFPKNTHKKSNELNTFHTYISPDVYTSVSRLPDRYTHN
jgi:hypothetical protein